MPLIAPGRDLQDAIGNHCTLGPVVLQLPITEATATMVHAPFVAVDMIPIELVGPDQLQS